MSIEEKVKKGGLNGESKRVLGDIRTKKCVFLHSLYRTLFKLLFFILAQRKWDHILYLQFFLYLAWKGARSGRRREADSRRNWQKSNRTDGNIKLGELHSDWTLTFQQSCEAILGRWGYIPHELNGGILSLYPPWNQPGRFENHVKM